MRPLAKVALQKMAGKFDLEEGYNVPASRLIKPAVGGLPVMVVGGLRRLDHMQAAVYASAEELLDQSHVDAIMLATPNYLLCELALAAVQAGKHVLAEKPIATNDREAARIEAATVRGGSCFMACYSLRFFVAQRQVYELLVAGAVGQIQAVTAGIGQGPLDDWFAQPEMGGGALLYLGSHLVDEVLWFVGDEPIQVTADVWYRPRAGSDETSAFQVRFAGGAVAQCLVTQAVEGWFDFVQIYGRQGRIGLTSSN